MLSTLRVLPLWTVLLALICLVGTAVANASIRSVHHRETAVLRFDHHHRQPSLSWCRSSRCQLERWRGGETEPFAPIKKDNGVTKKTKKKKKKKVSAAAPNNRPSPRAVKAAVSKALQETDAADALGQAIRNHADELRNDETKMISDSMKSLGWAMGAADHDATTGGIHVDPATVLANYFLKSHGGAHGLQSICSVLAAATGFTALLIPTSNAATRLALVRRCLIFAMVKHASGLLAGSFVAAQSIPLTGYRRAVVWVKDLANDPVSQYVFYTAILLLWLPSSAKTAAAAASTTITVPLDYWWKSRQVVPVILLAPILLREVLSTAFVVSDMLLLHATLARRQEDESSSSPGENPWLRKLLITSSTVMNAAMSLLVTPAKWKSSSVIERQEILAKLVSRLSIVFELAAGLILAVDVAFTTAGGGGLLKMAKQTLCLRLYLQFLWMRRRKIHRLAEAVRGGAAEVPFYLLGVLMDPRGAMGLEKDNDESSRRNQQGRPSWKDYATAAFDLN
jgi:hypothetical protein